MVETLNRETMPLADAFRRLGVGKTLGYTLVRDGRLPVLRLTPRKIVVTEEALHQLLAEGLPAAADLPDNALARNGSPG